MVVPDRIVQAERLVALAPGIARALVFLNDDRRHAELPEARAQPNGALAAADDQHIGLRFVTELFRLFVPQLFPGLCAGVHAVPRAERAGEARFLFVALELGYCCLESPDETVLDSDKAVAPRDLGLERNPGFEDAVRLGRDLALGNAPVARLRLLETMGQHVANLIAPFHGLDIPGEGDEIAPVALGAEWGDRLIDIAGRQRGVQLAEKGCHTSIGGLVDHWYPRGGFDPARGGGFRMEENLRAF